MSDSSTESGPRPAHALALQGVQTAKAASEKHQALNAWAYVDWSSAEAKAKQLDAQALARSQAGYRPLRLQGMTIAVKDLFNVDGMPTRAGTTARLPSLGAQQASLVTRLQREAALILGKTNMHEVALGGTGENPWTGDVKNPFDERHQAGGSSSGSAVAVACGMADAAIGTDTGGSIRIPAAFCGVVGFKPSYAAVPVDGGLVLSYSFDHAGPITKNVKDARLLYEVLTGKSAAHAVVPKRVRLGVPKSWLDRRLAADVAKDFKAVLEKLATQGVELVVVDLDAPLACAWKNYTNMARAEGAQVHREVLENRHKAATGFSDAVLQPLLAGLEISASDYVQASREREVGRGQLAAGMVGVDALLTPTSAVYPPKRGQTEVIVANGASMSVRDAVLGQTLAFSFYGLPTLSVPVKKDLSGMFPLGLQLVGHAAQDATVLAIGEHIEALLART